MRPGRRPLDEGYPWATRVRPGRPVNDVRPCVTAVLSVRCACCLASVRDPRWDHRCERRIEAWRPRGGPAGLGTLCGDLRRHRHRTDRCPNGWTFVGVDG